jgi:hypothetical protein
VNSSQKGQPGKTTPAATPQSDQPGKRIQLRIGLSDLAWSGSFVTNLVLYSPSFGARKIIPMNLRVTDNPVLPLFVIFLGVLGGFLANRLSKRWLPYQRNEYRLVKLKGELDRLYAVTKNPESRRKLYTLMENLDAAQEKNDAGTVDIPEIGTVESGLKTFREERAAEFGDIQTKAQRLRSQVGEYLNSAERNEAQRILDAISEVESRLSIDELDQAKEELEACQESFNKLRKQHFRSQLKTYKDKIKDLNLAPDDPNLTNINPLILKIEDALANNQLDQLPNMLNALQELIAPLLPTIRKIAKSRNQEEIAADAMRIEISTPPKNCIVNAKITFKAKVPDGTLKEGDQFQWRFGDGVVVTGKKGEESHRFDRAWNYQVECAILRGGVAVEELRPVTVMILPGPTEKALKQILQKIRINEAILSGFAFALAALTGLLALYANKPFGSLENYFLAFIWGFGIDTSIKGFSNISKKITE